MTITRYVRLPEAARKLHMKSKDLFHLVEIGKIPIAMITTTTGEVMLNELDVQAQIPRGDQPEYKKYLHLKGSGIGIGEAARKYSMPISTISRWVDKGYIHQLGSVPVRGGQKVLIDEADIAYCIEIYNRDRGQGKRVFNPDGNPYQKK